MAPDPGAHVQAYRGVRSRVHDFVAAADRDGTSPLTPAWSVGDLLAHVVGVSADVVAGNLEGAASDPWTAAQVAARAGHSIEELLAEWSAAADAFEAILGGVPAVVAGQVVTDAVTHEHDLRRALGRPGAQDSDAVSIAADWIATAAAGRKSEMTPAIALDYGSGSVVWGAGDPVAHVSITAFEFVRTAPGRRSAAQILAAGFPSVESAIGSPIFSPAGFEVIE